tara:strand:+ start:207 stop:866 length:660 start_codon:yes stop_codon:yes gene_type:complete
MAKFTVSDSQIRTFVTNIVDVYAQASTSEKLEGAAWYKNAFEACRELGIKHNVPMTIVVGVVAALSPNNKWTSNMSNADALLTGYLRGDGVEQVTVRTYHAMRQKAFNICALIPENGQECDVLALVETELRGQKIVSFFRNIMGVPSCTIDGHARNIAYAERLGLSGSKFTLGKVEYKVLQDAYVQASAIISEREGFHMLACVVQAVTWTVWRRMHNIT